MSYGSIKVSTPPRPSLSFRFRMTKKGSPQSEPSRRHIIIEPKDIEQPQTQNRLMNKYFQEGKDLVRIKRTDDVDLELKRDKVKNKHNRFGETDSPDTLPSVIENYQNRKTRILPSLVTLGKTRLKHNEFIDANGNIQTRQVRKTKALSLYRVKESVQTCDLDDSPDPYIKFLESHNKVSKLLKNELRVPRLSQYSTISSKI